jgi:hypothetical protein
VFLLALVSPAAIPVFAMRRYVSGLGVAVGQAWGNLYIALGDTVDWTDQGVRRRGIAYDVSIDAGYRLISEDGRTHRLALPDVHAAHVAVDEGQPPAWACSAVCDSGLDRACDFRAPKVRKSRGWIIF